MLNKVKQLGTLLGVSRPQETEMPSTQNNISTRSTTTRASLYALLGASALTVLSAEGCTLDRRGLLDPNAVSDGGGGLAEGGAGTGGMEDGGGGTGGTGGTGGMETGGGGTGGCEPTNPSTELCDGVDNDCDPSTQDGSEDPEVNASCDTGLDGVCATGSNVCESGGISCVPDNQPALEVCGNSMDEDCNGVDDNGCDVTLSFPTLVTDCYKLGHFDEFGVLDTNSSTPNTNVCSKLGISSTYQPGHQAQVWVDFGTLEFDASEAPKSVELRCSPFSSDPNHADLTTAVEANNYSDAGNTAVLGSPAINGQTYTYSLSGCVDEKYDARITY